VGSKECPKRTKILSFSSLTSLAMANTTWLLYYLTRRRFSPSFRSFFFIPTSLALFTSLFILFYISTTSTLFFSNQQPSIPHLNQPLLSGSSSMPQINISNNTQNPFAHVSNVNRLNENDRDGRESQRSLRPQFGSSDGKSSLKQCFCFETCLLLWIFFRGWICLELTYLIVEEGYAKF
jgi:hypothetical protein